MTRLHADQLTAAQRRQLGIPTTRSKGRRGDERNSQPCAGSCDCGARFENYRAWEKHSDATGHGIWRIRDVRRRM